MKHKGASILLFSLISVFTIAAVIGIATGGNKNKPKAQGTVTSILDTDQFFDASVPVGILRVTSLAEPQKPYKPDQVIVENRSSKKIEEITFRWSLTTMEDRETILQRGLMEPTKFRFQKKQLLAKKRQTIKLSMRSLKEILQDVKASDTVSGNYLFKIGISAVVFEDGSVWREDTTANSPTGSVQRRITEPLETAHATSQPPQTIACNKTLCKIVLDSNGQPTGLLNCAYDDYPQISRQECFYIGIACQMSVCDSTSLIDHDNDLYDSTVDCDDDDYFRNPGVTEECQDGIDNDCDVVTDCEDSNCSLDAACQPTPTPNPCDGVVCELRQFCSDGICMNQSPILIDVMGNGFNLTSAADGVSFDFNGDGIGDHLAWTAPDSDDAWLVLDRNFNGSIDNGKELFGNITPQPVSATPNGFLALAEYDKQTNGGNSDGVINKKDNIFTSLRFWQDTNHNGYSESWELHTLPELGIAKLYLDYKESKRTDQYGNQFKYRAKVKDKNDAQVGRWAWDVFLVSAP
jgi:hypothetical protein